MILTNLFLELINFGQSICLNADLNDAQSSNRVPSSVILFVSHKRFSNAVNRTANVVYDKPRGPNKKIKNSPYLYCCNMERLEAQVGQPFLPGDILVTIEDLENDSDVKIKFGPGIWQDSKEVIASKYGILRMKEKPICFWIETNQKRYVAMKDDTVIGIIASRGGDSYKVDIGTSQMATLSSLAFEGATKRHKPNLQINDIVFARLIVANKDMEPEISCMGEDTKSNNLGQLKGGYMFSVSLGLSRQLLSIPECLVLNLLGKHFAFEITVGMNGRIWINSKGTVDTIAIANAIVNSEFMDDTQITVMVRQLVDSMAGFDDEMDE